MTQSNRIQEFVAWLKQEELRLTAMRLQGFGTYVMQIAEAERGAMRLIHDRFAELVLIPGMQDAQQEAADRVDAQAVFDLLYPLLDPIQRASPEAERAKSLVKRSS